MQHIDLFTWLRGDILVKADKMTMANSLELRVFLDPEVFAVASRLPFDQKITRTTTKYALRRALEPIVPAHAPPRQTRVPGAHSALAAPGELMDWAYRMIGASGAGHPGGPGRRGSHARPAPRRRGDHSRRLWTVLIFLLWYAIFVEGSIVPQISEPQYPVQL